MESKSHLLLVTRRQKRSMAVMFIEALQPAGNRSGRRLLPEVAKMFQLAQDERLHCDVEGHLEGFMFLNMS